MSSKDEIMRNIGAVLRKRAENGGRHLHHSACIHNLPPVEQVEARGKTVEWWEFFIGALPVQITAADWQTDPPDFASAVETDPAKIAAFKRQFPTARTYEVGDDGGSG